MAGITLEQAQAQLDAWMAASIDVATNGKSVTIAGRTFTAAELDQINRQIEFWDLQVRRLTRGGGITVIGGIPG